LHTLLEQAAIAGPYVLVGHSIGGMYVRVYAAQYPNEVAGLVLVDSSHPDQLTRAPATRAEQESFQRMLQYMPLLARLGVIRIGGLGDTMANGLPAGQRAETIAFLTTPEHLASTLAEYMAWTTTTEQTRGASSLGSRPLVVLTAGAQSDPDARTLQAELPALSSNSVQHIIGQATHLSLLNTREDAQATSAAILQVVEAARTNQPLTP
jgi:pimeloyl-ACP methyl ester carboxylesterase